MRDFDAANQWYTDVLGAQTQFSKDHPHARGKAARHSLGDIDIEPISSDDPSSNIFRVCERYGERLYSTAWLVDDLGTCYDELRKRGVRVFAADGRPLTHRPRADAFFTHPKDTFGTIEFALAGRHAGRSLTRPQIPPGGTAIISLVPDAPRAAQFYIDALGATRADAVGGPDYRETAVTLPGVSKIVFREPRPGTGLHDALQQRGVGPFGLSLAIADWNRFERQLSDVAAEPAALRTDRGLTLFRHGVWFEFKRAG